jgi:DNA topoisomerase-3
MILYLAEKPSLGKAIAAQLPGPRKATRTHIECGGVTVSWAFGHLYEQAEPDAYLPDSVPKNGKGRKKWRLEDLPIIPQEWQKVPKSEAREQLAAIRRLLKDAAEVVNAGDPDREGQLLIDEILEAMHWRGPTKRIWLAALDPASVQKALADLKDNAAYRPLRDAAEARARADWLVGMNLTRGYTLKSNGQGVVAEVACRRQRSRSSYAVMPKSTALRPSRSMSRRSRSATSTAITKRAGRHRRTRRALAPRGG